jgi:hydrogenase maturation protease
MQFKKSSCLVLACGNTLRSDDGVGPRLAEWASHRFRDDCHVRVVARQQWTPDLAAVLFVDSSVDSVPGRVSLIPVEAKSNGAANSAHQLGAPELLGLSRTLYGSQSAHAMLLTVGAGSTAMGEAFSDSVEAALPRASGVLEKAVLRFMEN